MNMVICVDIRDFFTKRCVSSRSNKSTFGKPAQLNGKFGAQIHMTMLPKEYGIG